MKDKKIKKLAKKAAKRAAAEAAKVVVPSPVEVKEVIEAIKAPATVIMACHKECVGYKECQAKQPVDPEPLQPEVEDDGGFAKQLELEAKHFPWHAEWREVFPTLTKEDFEPFYEAVEIETARQWDVWTGTVPPSVFGATITGVSPQVAAKTRLDEAIVMAYSAIKSLVLCHQIELFMAGRKGQIQ